MRILYLGLPLGALHLIGSGFAPVAILLGHPDAPGARRLRRVAPRETLILGRPRLEDESLVRVLASTKPDVLMSFFWPRRIPESVLGLAERGAFGTHPSLLPRWRGPDPYFWAISEGDTVTGVTLHRLARDYDTGAIITQREVPLRHELNAWTLARALDRPALALLADAARRLRDGERLEGEPQDDALSTHAPEPSDADYSVDWDDDAESIVRLVRASAPVPGALADVEDATIEIVRASVHRGTVPGALEPAEAFIDDGFVVVRTGRGAVRLESVRDAEGEPIDLVEHVKRAQRDRDHAS